MEAFYFKVVIPQITYCISVWGDCSVAKLTEIEFLTHKSRQTHSQSPTEFFGQWSVGLYQVARSRIRI